MNASRPHPPTIRAARATCRLLLCLIWPMAVGPMALAAAQGVPNRQPPQRSDSTTPTAPGFGAILGNVVDSLHDAPLVDAVVTVVQLPRRSGMTTSAGIFRIDSIPPGRYTIEILHPVLDSLGIRLVSDTVAVSADAMQAVTLEIPGEDALVARFCPDAKRQFGPAALVGQVLDPDTNTPATGAEVSVAWVETRASTIGGVQSTPSVRRATVGNDGTYRICGLPSNLSATLQAQRGSTKTGEVQIAFHDGALLGIRNLRLAPSAPASGSKAGTAGATATVTGIVTNNGGVPINGARIAASNGTATASSATDGTFTLQGVPLGTQVLEARRVGYDPVYATVDVTSAGPNRVTIRLGEAQVVLKPVDVKTTLAPELDRVGFNRRKKQGLGRYVTEEDIQKYQPVYTSDILRRISGIYVYGSGTNLTVVSSRDRGCVRYLIDNNRADANQGVTIDELVRPNDIAAIEFYQQNDVPGELQRGRNSGCALLVVWTKSQVTAKEEKR